MPQQRPQNRPPRRHADRASDAQSEVRYPIPAASAQAFAGRDQNRPQNPGLIFDRFAPDWSRQSTLKKDGLEAVRRAAERVDKQLLREWNTRWQDCAKAANGEPFGLTTDWRLIAGLGRKGSLEVGFTFHRYGFPILPGSSVKGVARAWALLQIAEKVGTTELKELDGILSADGDKEREKYEDWKAGQPAEVQKLADDFRTVFGTTAAAGRAVFFDAIPASLPTLELDIMNPHYPKYYSGEEPPTDWQSPVPVYFLTVAANTEFRFAVGWRGALDEEGRRLRNLAQTWLIEGLTQLGAGAKTSAGYGYFLPPQPSQPAGAMSRSAATTQALQPAPTSPTPALPATPVPSEELVWRTGTVREYRPDKRAGRLVDDETGEELPFRQEAIPEKGWSPGKKHKVRYAVAEREGHRVVVKVQRA
jgi:CRISPR-associated protein Cmr6